MANNTNGAGVREAGITDSEHFSPYRADGKLVSGRHPVRRNATLANIAI